MANYVSSRDSSFLLLLAFPEVVSTFISLLGAKIGVQEKKITTSGTIQDTLRLNRPDRI
jgi:hypothetical protein